MDIQPEHLLTEALKLPVDLREDLAARLMVSVEPAESEVAEIQRAWVEEIDRRVASLERGETAAVPIEEVWPNLAGRPWRSQQAGDE